MPKRVWSCKLQAVIDEDTGEILERYPEYQVGLMANGEYNSCHLADIDKKYTLDRVNEKERLKMEEKMVNGTEAAEKAPKDLSVCTIVGTKIIEYLQSAHEVGEYVAVENIASAIDMDFFKVAGVLSELTKQEYVTKNRVDKKLAMALTDAGADYDVSQEPRKPNRQSSGTKARKAEKRAEKRAGFQYQDHLFLGKTPEGDKIGVEILRSANSYQVAVNGEVRGRLGISQLKTLTVIGDNWTMTFQHKNIMAVMDAILNSPLRFDVAEFDPSLELEKTVIDILWDGEDEEGPEVEDEDEDGADEE